MKQYRGRVLILGLGLASLSAQAAGSAGRELFYIGTVGPDGIYSAWLDPVSGDLSPPKQALVLSRAQWLALSPRLPVLYAVAATDAGRAANSVIYSLTVDRETGALKVLNAVDAGGVEATYLDIDARSSVLVSANHDSDSVSTFPVLSDGSLGQPPKVQSEAGSAPNPAPGHVTPHCAVIDPSGKYVLVADLGANRVSVYRLEAATGRLTPASELALAPGAGPLHLLFDPRGKFVYLLTELSAEVYVLRWDGQQGRLRPVQSLTTYPSGYTQKKFAAALVLSRDGRFLYVSMRGNNSIVAYEVDPRAGTLKESARLPSGGQSPRALTIDPSGHWLLVAHDASDSVAAFRIDPVTGQLRATGQSIPIPKPTDLLFYSH